MKKVILFVMVAVICLAMFSGCLRKLPYAKFTPEYEKIIFTMDDVSDFEINPSYEKASPEFLAIEKNDRVMYSYVEKLNKDKNLPKDAQRYWIRTSVAKYLDEEIAKTTYTNFYDEYSKYTQEKTGEITKIENVEDYNIDRGYTFRDNDNFIVGVLKGNMYYDVYFISDKNNTLENIMPKMMEKLNLAAETINFVTGE
ncbi:MAG: hypothetical protein IKZ25_00860 [Clostridia bacterium]|nr:hypothetical protein [Clostridia bacterium]